MPQDIKQSWVRCEMLDCTLSPASPNLMSASRLRPTSSGSSIPAIILAFIAKAPVIVHKAKYRDRRRMKALLETMVLLAMLVVVAAGEDETWDTGSGAGTVSIASSTY